MDFKEAYTTARLKEAEQEVIISNPEIKPKEEKKIEVTEEAYAVCELLESLIKHIETLRLANIK